MKFHFQKKKKKNSDFQICGSRGESQYGGFRQKGTLVAQDIWNQMVEMWELFFIFTFSSSPISDKKMPNAISKCLRNEFLLGMVLLHTILINLYPICSLCCV